MQYVKGFSPDRAGLLMMVQPFFMALLSPLAGRISDRVEPRVISSVGMLLLLMAFYALSRLDEATSLVGVLFPLALTGCGFGLFSSPNANAIMGSVRAGSFGSASGVMGTMRVLGQTVGMGLVSLVFALTLGPATIQPDQFDALLKSISLYFMLAIVLTLFAIGFSLARGRLRPAREQKWG